VINLFDDLPCRADEELFTELLSRKGVRIERIVSTGQSTPPDKPYDQEYDEWVLLVTGSAGLWIDEAGERDLRPGDYVLIPAHRPHRVTWTPKASRPFGSPYTFADGPSAPFQCLPWTALFHPFRPDKKIAY
jgi:cupin 2 domain-containing protein